MVFTQDPAVAKASDVVEMVVTIKQFGLNGTYIITDLWSHKNIGKFVDHFVSTIKRLGAGLCKILVN